MLVVRTSIDRKSISDLLKLPEYFESAVNRAMYVVAGKAQELAKEQYSMSGLGRRTGKLRDTIKSGVIKTAGRNQIWIGSDQIYAKVHEGLGFKFGDTTTTITGRPHLAFMGKEGKLVVVHQVKVPSRPFLRPVLVRNKGTLAKVFEDAVTKYMNRRR